VSSFRTVPVDIVAVTLVGCNGVRSVCVAVLVVVEIPRESAVVGSPTVVRLSASDVLVTTVCVTLVDCSAVVVVSPTLAVVALTPADTLVLGRVVVVVTPAVLVVVVTPALTVVGPIVSSSKSVLSLPGAV
jgi:hypothetical protein